VTVVLRRSVAGYVVCNAYECLCNRQKGVGGHIIQAQYAQNRKSVGCIILYWITHFLMAGRERGIEST